MDKANLALVRIIQFSILVFFALVLSAFFGTLLLLPLALLYHVIGFLDHGIGFNGIFAFFVAVPAVIYVFYLGYRIPGFYNTVMDTGFKLYHLARDQHLALEKIARTIKGLPEETGGDAQTSTSH